MRLFTFGCSFTLYNWPTWADLLGHSFLLHQNWGIAGAGNRAIAERVAESHMINKFNNNDVVIVQWSEYNRNDYAKFNRISKNGTMWCTLGSPASLPNKEIYDLTWFKKFWDQKAYYIHTLNNIILVQQLLESTGCKWYMTSMNDLMLPPVEAENLTEDTDKFNLFDVNRDLLDYKKFIWDDRTTNWLPPLIEEKWVSSDLDWVFNIDPAEKKDVPYFQPRGTKFVEPHLTTKQYANYLNKIELDLPLEHNLIKESVEEFECIYEESDHDWNQFMTSLNSNKFNIIKPIFGK
jgi:hypothetical protein